jgi:hypothetical protein
MPAENPAKLPDECPFRANRLLPIKKKFPLNMAKSP